MVVGACALVVLAGAVASTAEDQTQSPTIDPKGIDFFERQIRPVLVERCYKCHSIAAETIQGGLRLDDRRATQAGGDSGPAVQPGNADESYLLQAINYTGEFYDMPPDGKLPDDVIADFRRWIEMGAPDPREAPEDDAAPRETPTAAGREELWVLQPLQRPDIPPEKNSTWPRGVVDQFVLAKLETAGLAPAGAADRYTLLRRVTYDLTGLPPTPGEIDAFVADSSAGAYEKVVDRLLASPAFGEHWARHWFDLSCYADLADVQGDVVVHSAWRYRDYVIDAFNNDKPFDRFILEQIAGDLLPYDSVLQQREQMIATGYLSIGPWALQNYVKQQLDADVVDHQIDKIGRTFLGMSIRCARCHDHKFDPIPTRDYYALAGIFHSTLTTRYDGPGVWSQIVTRPLPNLPSDDQQATKYENTLADLKAQRTELEAKRRALGDDNASGQPVEKVVSNSGNAITLETPIAANLAGRRYRVSFAAGPTVWSVPSQATTQDDGILVQVLRKDGTLLVNHVCHPGEWLGRPNAQELHEQSFEYDGDGTGDVTIHVVAYPLGTARFGGAFDNLKVTDAKSNEEVFGEDFNSYQGGSAIGSQAHTQLRVHGAGVFPGWRGGGINNSHAVEMKKGGGETNFSVQLYSGDRATSDNPRVRELDEQLTDLVTRLQLLEYDRPTFTQAMSVQDVAEPHDAPIYVRGNFKTPGEMVPRGFLSAICEESSPPIAEGASGRIELAQWLTSEQNPVTPRVLANRVWQHIFGAGLVRSVDYFGVHGEKPSHPELLDYLAIRFRNDLKWSLKGLIRELVLSSVYQMASSNNSAATTVDPDNRLLWRMNRRRLTAESIRDGMLAISGRLDHGRGGPSLGLEIPGNVNGIGDNVNLPTYSGRKIPDRVVRRRAIYLPFFRKPPGGELEVLNVFDFPHPSEITGQRAERTIATQALFLLNSPFVREQSKYMAERLLSLRTSGEPVKNKALLHDLYLLVLNRPPDASEAGQGIGYLGEYREARSAMPDPPVDLELEAWADFCRALFASNEFLFNE
ncbi:MAG: PSD1 and planctomycete cytochrome C domain-containing protein [Pirellulales bacterium]